MISVSDTISVQVSALKSYRFGRCVSGGLVSATRTVWDTVLATTTVTATVWDTVLVTVTATVTPKQACGEFGLVRFLVVCLLYKINPNPHEKLFAVGKKWQKWNF